MYKVVRKKCINILRFHAAGSSRGCFCRQIRFETNSDRERHILLEPFLVIRILRENFKNFFASYYLMDDPNYLRTSLIRTRHKTLI